MSQEAREALVNSPNAVFQRTSQRDDLLDESLTQTDLIALLTDRSVFADDGGDHIHIGAQ